MIIKYFFHFLNILYDNLFEYTFKKAKKLKK